MDAQDTFSEWVKCRILPERSETLVKSVGVKASSENEFCGGGSSGPWRRALPSGKQSGKGQLSNSFDGFLEEMKFRWSIDIGA